MGFDLVALLHHFENLVHIAEVQLRIDTLRVHVEPKGHNIDIAGAFTVAQKCSLHTIRTRH